MHTVLIDNQICCLLSLSILLIAVAVLVGSSSSYLAILTHFIACTLREKPGDFYYSRERKSVWSTCSPIISSIPQVWRSCCEVIMKSQWEQPLLSSHFCWYSHPVTTFKNHWMEFIQLNFHFPSLKAFPGRLAISIGGTSDVMKAGTVVILHNDERVQTTLPYPLSCVEHSQAGL